MILPPSQLVLFNLWPVQWKSATVSRMHIVQSEAIPSVRDLPFSFRVVNIAEKVRMKPLMILLFSLLGPPTV